MKRVLLIIICLFYILGKSQIDTNFLYNDWYLVKLEMRDGSKPFLSYKNSDSNYNFVIEHNNKYAMCNTESLFYYKVEPYISFRLTNNKMITSLESSLNIESLNQDSLILSQNILGQEKKDLLKFYLIRKDIIYNKELKKNINKDTLYANNILAPKYLDRLSYRTIKDLTYKKNTKPEKKPTYRFNGYIILDNLNKSSKVFLKEYKKDSIELITQKIKPLEKFENWDTSHLMNFKVIKIPFNFISYNNIKKTTQSLGEVFQLFSLEYQENSYGPSIEEIRKSYEYYTKGVSYYQAQNLEKAAEYFELSFKENKHNLDAYYNYSAIKFENKQIEEACKIWEFLKNEGQKEAEKFYNEKCIKK